MAEIIGSLVLSTARSVFFSACNNVFTVRRSFRHVINYEQNLSLMKDPMKNLEEQKMEVGMKIDEASRLGALINEEVKHWMVDVDVLMSKVEEMARSYNELAMDSYCFGSFPNLKSRYLLWRLALRLAKEADFLWQRGREFHTISFFPVQRQDVALLKRKQELAAVANFDGSENFNSRRDVLKEIMEALLSPSINSIGVYGTAGVGKTMLVEQIKRKAEEVKLFDVVVMAKVTKIPDLKRIQDEIARDLGLDLPDRVTRKEAANLIKSRLTNRKVLVILDDIWADMDLQKVGIPSGNKQKPNQPTEEKNGKMPSVEDQTECTVLLTSRELGVLSHDNQGMHTQKNFEVDPLEEGEARELFWKIAGFEKKEIAANKKAKMGKQAETQFLLTIAEEISKKCEGLPIAIATLANTLKCKSRQKWRITLLRLQKDRKLNGMSPSLYSAIELRYSELKSKELKQTLLLCSLMGHNAGLQDLLKYGMGLGLFPRAKSIEKARDEALKLVSELIRDYSLLLDVGSIMQFDMHELIREVAISIASEDHGVYAFKKDAAAKQRLDKKALKKCRWIYLSNVYVSELPDELKCPQLTFFHLSTNNDCQNIPTNLFRGAEGLRVLGFTKVRFSSIPQSISLLINLHTLCLDQSEFGELGIGSIIGELKNLQVLSLAGCDIQKLPKEIEKLIRLKFLDLSDCTELKEIPPDVLSRLSQLEELYMGNSFDQWEDIQNDDNKKNATLVELRQLEKLTALDVHIHDIRMIPVGLFSTALKKYKIFIGDVWNYWDSAFENSKTLKLKLDGYIAFDYSVRKLLNKAEELHLEKLNCVKNVVNELDDHGFQELKHLHVKNDLEIQHMFYNSVSWIRTNVFPKLELLFLHNLIQLENIIHGQLEEMSFNKLGIITVERCNKLKNLFSSSLAKQLLHLQEIRVTDCTNIVEIFYDEGQGDDEEHDGTIDIAEATDVIKLTQLKRLRLHHLPQFISFSQDKETSSNCSSFFSEKVEVPELQELQLSWIDIETIWRPGLSPNSKWNLAKLIIEGCDNLENIFSQSIVRCLEKLKHIEIRECRKLREIIVTENAEDVHQKNKENVEDEDKKIYFSELNVLQVEDLENLVGFYLGNYRIEFPSLKQLAIENCPKLKGFVVDSTTTNDIALFDDKVEFPNLERITISHLKNLRIIWKELPKNSFRRLNFLRIEDLQSLIGLCTGNLYTEFSDLKQLTIENCQELNGFMVDSMTNGYITSGIQTLFDEKVSFPNLERMTISHLKNLKIIWKNLAEKSFCNLKSLRVTYCQNLSSIFPSNNDMLRKLLKSLERLDIFGCSSVEEVFELGQSEMTESDAEINSQLKELYIDQLPRLRHVWKKNLQGTDTFQNLELVTVYRCDNLSHLFPFSLAKKLSKLKRLEIQSCTGMEEIVAMESGEEECDSSLFPLLSCLILYSLPRLSCFYPGKHTTCWEALYKFYSNWCGKEKKTNEQGQLEFPFLSLKKDSPKLKKLSLTADHIKIISKDQRLTACLFKNIKVLRIQCYKDESTVLPIDFIQNFNRLEKLTVESCDFKKLFPSNSKSTELESIKRLKLNSLPNLEHIWSQDSSVPQNLEKLKVWDCNSLISLSTSVASFQALTTLDIWSCQEMMNLVSFSTVQILEKLKSLSIRECYSMTEIVGSEGHATQEEINFKKLRYLRLECLIRLTSFCSGNLTFKFPSLERLLVNWCPNMKSFCQGVLETPVLQRVQSLKRKDNWHLANNLNAIIKKLYEEKVGYSGLEILELSAFPELIGKWNLDPQEFFSFRQLTTLEVSNVDNLTYLLIPSMAIDLVKLERLNVKKCEMMEHIIKGGAEKLEEIQLTFGQLKFITLESCSKLTSFSTGSYTLKFPSLTDVTIADCPNMVTFASIFSRDQEQETTESLFRTKVEFFNLELLVVEGCGRLKYLMTFSMVQSFSQLKRLVIRSCKKIEEVIVTEGFAEENGNSRHLFHKLSSMELEDLPELTRFCSELESLSTTTFVFPEVTSLKFSNLPKLKSFFPQHATEWPLLKSMQLYECNQVQIFALEIPSCQARHGVEDNQLKIQSQHPLFWINKEQLHLCNEESKHEPFSNSLLDVQEGSSSNTSFGNLESLEVSRCHGLVTLLRYTIAKRLKQLSTMSITDCSKLEEIMACVDDVVKDELVFTHFRSLRLCGLSSLESFCSSNCDFNFPSLHEVIISDSPKMQTFCKGAVKTGKLQKVKSTEDDDGIWNNDLNSTIIYYLSNKKRLDGLKKEKESIHGFSNRHDVLGLH